MVEPPVSYLEPTVPAAALVLLVASYLFEHGLPAALLPHPTTAMAKEKITGGELSARSKENSYQRGAHRDKDSLQH